MNENINRIEKLKTLETERRHYMAALNDASDALSSTEREITDTLREIVEDSDPLTDEE